MIKKTLILASALALSSTVIAEDADHTLSPLLDSAITVTTSPPLDQPLAYDGSDFIYNYSSINHDFALLQLHQQMNQYYSSNNIDINKPTIIISGAVEAGAASSASFHGDTEYSSTLNTAEIDVAAILNDWAEGFIAYDYQDVPTSFGSRSPQNDIYLSRAYATIGNLDQSPVYLTTGQMYVPFGRYNTTMLLTTPATESMGRILTNTSVLGYSKNGFSAQAFVYNSTASGNTALANQQGFDVGYQQKEGNHPFQLGASYVSNIADAQGMQDNGYGDDTATSNPDFSGFYVNSYNNVTNVPGYDVYGSFGINSFTLVGEYITASKAFRDIDLSYNGAGAKPRSMQAEIDYGMEIHAKPTTIELMYNQTWQALALNLPQSSYSIGANTSLWRNTVESLEYSYNINYNTNDTSGGANGKTGQTGGGTSNVIVAQIGVYF